MTDLYVALEEMHPGLTKHQGFPHYMKQLGAYLDSPGREDVVDVWPCLDDNPVDLYYFYQDVFAAQQVLRNKPSLLVDVGSTALLAGIFSLLMPTLSLDIRPLKGKLSGLGAICADIKELPFGDESVEMLTSMCVIEHVGLGRYGGELDIHGSEKAFAEVRRVTRPGGRVIFSVPLANESAVQFNAHRIFTKPQVLEYLPEFSIERELFLFPEPRTEQTIQWLKPNCFCIWCAHMVKDSWHTSRPRP